MRIVVVSENMGPPLDEGIRKFATSLVDGFAAYGEAQGVATGPEFAGDPAGRILHAPGGKLFTGRALSAALGRLAPDLVVYVPSASGTTFSFLRAQALGRICPGARISLVLAQQRAHMAPVRRLLSHAAPGIVFCQSFAAVQYMESLGIEARYLPSGVDLRTFRPVGAARRLELRLKYGLPAGEYLVFHAGHLKAERNAGLLGKLEGSGRGVMLAGRSMGLDAELKREMEGRGVIVIDRYVENVHELYQAVDCYLFPVREGDSAMEFPLSVLEAMACDLPVVAYPYGGLDQALLPEDGLTFARTDDGLIAAVRDAEYAPVNTRAQAEFFSWERVAAEILNAAAEMSDAGTVTATI
jgi:glycosyltransferase involved in cell wall biosynthesis